MKTQGELENSIRKAVTVEGMAACHPNNNSTAIHSLVYLQAQWILKPFSDTLGVKV